MDLELKIANFGPIDAATVQVGPFTVFAGPNNTGKTLVSKMLYSMLDARNANHALAFDQNVYRNFQVPDFSTLEGDGDSPLYFSVEGVGELRELKGADFKFIPSPQIVENTQSFPEVFYLESPLYWKLKNPLESIKLGSRSPLEHSLNGVPAYFYDLAASLRRTHIDHRLTGIHNRLHDAIGGKIALSEAGDLEFQKNGKSIPLSLASAGVANMGMLALLIERGALERGSFLFFNEPESNLHSAWQVEMAAILFELARQGVNVVVSTHSMTILKWLEVHIKENPEDRELVRLNKFPPDAEWNDDMDAVLAEVKQSLTKPFSDLYVKGL